MFQLGNPLSNQKTQTKRGKKAALKIRCLTLRQIPHAHTHKSLRAGKATKNMKESTGKGKTGWKKEGTR